MAFRGNGLNDQFDNDLRVLGNVLGHTITPTNDKDLVNKEYVDNKISPQTFLHEDLTDVTASQHHTKTVSSDIDYDDIQNKPTTITTTQASNITSNTSSRHTESHTIASHSDTGATGANLTTLTDNSIADTLHRHSELVASDGSPDPALSVDASGNVGIGISAPDCKLDVNKGSLGVITKMKGANNERFTIRNAAENDWRLYTYDDTETEFKSMSLGGVGRAIYIQADGDVGIGTTSPSYPLDVVGQMYSSKGRAPTGIYHEDNVEEGDLFDAMSPSIPTVGNKILMTGAIYENTDKLTVSYAERISTTRIAIKGLIESETGTIWVDDGGVEEYYLSIAW